MGLCSLKMKTSFSTPGLYQYTRQCPGWSRTHRPDLTKLWPNLTRSNIWTPTVCSAQSSADQLASWLAPSFWLAGSLGWVSRLTELISACTAVGVSFTVNALVSLDGGRVCWWQGWSEWFSFSSDAPCLGNSHCHQVVTVYGCGYLKSSATCFDRHRKKIINQADERWKGQPDLCGESLPGSCWPRQRKNIDMRVSSVYPRC